MRVVEPKDDKTADADADHAETIFIASMDLQSETIERVGENNHL